MKLTKKVIYVTRHKKRENTSRDIAMDIKVSKWRVNQIWRKYLLTGEEPIIEQNMERPSISTIGKGQYSVYQKNSIHRLLHFQSKAQHIVHYFRTP